MRPKKYWIIVASRDHVQRGVEGSFMQANHGKASALKRMQAGDGILYYSSKEIYGEETKCQRFTALGEIADDLVYQGVMGGGFVPFRRNVGYRSCQEISILPLIGALDFIKDKTHWGAPFRFGMVEIGEQDFQLIAEKMLEK
ncbi:MAG: EVE domain-containing protein [Bacteroidota bacterium]